MRVGLLRGFYKPQATGHEPRASFKNPHPGPPQRGGRLVRCKPQPRASRHRHRHHVLRTTYYELRTIYPKGGHTGPPLRRDNTHHESRATTTSHKLQATCRLSRFPGRGRSRRPSSRGPCRTNRQDSVAAALPATSYALRAVPHLHHVPRTTHHVPAEADTRVRPYDEITCSASYEPRATTTGHKLQATGRCLVIPTQRALRLARAGTQTGEVSVARGCCKKRW